MKCTIFVTQQCNLNCSYCYIKKKDALMSRETAGQVIDFIFRHAPPGEKIEVGYFGGEPLREFDVIREMTGMFRKHPDFPKAPVEFTVVTNGTIFNEEIAHFVKDNDMGFGISCDGPPDIQDKSRVFPGGGGSSGLVEQTLRRAVKELPSVMVNAVYTPATYTRLPETVAYFSSLGIRQIYLTPDYSAAWTEEDAKLLPEIYGRIAGMYIDFYLDEDPHYISLIDGKITVIMRGGYQPGERCRMGRGEYAFAPSGNIYPCERLVGEDDGGAHCIGHVSTGLDAAGMCRHIDPESEVNKQCLECGVNDYCMNWCGCSNYFSSGYYNRVGAFLCASERTAVVTAFEVFQVLDRQKGSVFMEHLAGSPMAWWAVSGSEPEEPDLQSRNHLKKNNK